MSKTTETDATARGIDQSNFADSWKDDFEEFMWVPADFARKLERERDELAAWKESAMIVSRQCDIQAVGTLLNVPLGHPVHPAIEPGIRELQAKLAIANGALEWANAELGKCTKPNPVTEALGNTLKQTQP